VASMVLAIPIGNSNSLHAEIMPLMHLSLSKSICLSSSICYTRILSI